MTESNKEGWREWDFPLRVAANRVAGVSLENQFGFNPTVVSNVLVDIWYGGGILSHLSTAETMDMASTSADDDAGGIGAQSVILFGVDNNYSPIQETVTLDGLTPVTTLNSFLRINNMKVDTVGSSSMNAGIITATATSSATLQDSIAPNMGTDFNSHYTIPAGYYGFVCSWVLGARSFDQFELDFQLRNLNGAWTTLNRLDSTFAAYQQQFLCSLVIPPKADIRVQARQISANPASIVATTYDMYIVKEELVTSSNVITPLI